MKIAKLGAGMLAFLRVIASNHTIAQPGIGFSGGGGAGGTVAFVGLADTEDANGGGVSLSGEDDRAKFKLSIMISTTGRIGTAANCVESQRGGQDGGAGKFIMPFSSVMNLIFFTSMRWR